MRKSCVNASILESVNIRLFEMFYEGIIDAQCFLFYISLLNYARI